MSEIIEKTYKLLDTLDNSELIKDLTYYKNKLLKNNDILTLIKDINKETNNENKIILKKKLYTYDDYKKYINMIIRLSFIFFKIIFFSFS